MTPSPSPPPGGKEVSKEQPYDTALFEQLRRTRMEIAQQESLPAYMILHDSVLRELARQKPRTLEELRGVPGIGERKVTNYGETILRAIASVASR